MTMLLQALVLVFLNSLFAGSDSASIVNTLPGFSGELPFKLETGYVGVGELEDVQLFYYFIESEGSPENDPLVLWLTGGPGCSALSALVYEIGPLSFDYAASSGKKPVLKQNDFSWTKVASIIFVDAPVGTGFSYAKTWQGYSNMSETLSAAQSYEFLRKWIVDHPKFVNNPLYIAGDSYSGIPLPVVVQDISNGNKDGQMPFLNLQGYVLGNPVTDFNQSDNYKVIYAYHNGLIPYDLYQSTKTNCGGEYVTVDANNTLCLDDLKLVTECVEDITQVHILEPKCTLQSPNPTGYSENLLSLPQLPRRWCREDNYILSKIWANDKTVQDALHVREGTIENWERCNYTVLFSFTYDFSSFVYHENLTQEAYRVLIYSGDQDLSIPYPSTMAWIENLNLTVDSEWKPWFVDGQVAGYRVEYTTHLYEYRLTFTTIKGAGHTAPEYKPEECLAMVSRWFARYPL